MDSQKAEPLLNLAISLPEMERMEDKELTAGYDFLTKQWEIIVKYNGDIKQYEKPGIQIEQLKFGYAIVTLKEAFIETFLQLEEIEYAEKPKLFFPQNTLSLAKSGIISLWNEPYNLSGKGIYIGIIDSGIDYTNPAFIRENQTSRIEVIFDQVQKRVFTNAEINQALQTKEVLETQDNSGHGTAVASIAAGGLENFRGGAYEADLVVVRLNQNNQDSFPLTTALLRGVDACIDYAFSKKKPIAINISFGNTYGAHNGESLVEQYINEATTYGRNVICVGVGNEGETAGHTSGTLLAFEEREIEFSIGFYERALSLQLWHPFTEKMRVTLYAPDGQSIFFVQEDFVNQRLMRKVKQTNVIVYGGGPTPYSTWRELYFSFQGEQFIEVGTWKVVIQSVSDRSTPYRMYLPAQGIKSESTRFLEPNPEQTFTIPSTAKNVISVGAYDSTTDAYAGFSGRGVVGRQNEEGVIFTKPDIVAPGVLVDAVIGNEILPVSGTSFATPYVTAVCALLMEWGIVQGKDPYMYGQKLKAYLQAFATPLPDAFTQPNDRVGYGALNGAQVLRQIL